MMRSILLLPFLVPLGCATVQDETVLFPDACSAIFESLAELEIKEPSAGRTFAKSLDEDVIRQDLNTDLKETLDRMGFDIEHTIGIWKKHKGKDLSAYVTEDHLHFLVPKDSIIDGGTRVSFSAPDFNSDTSFFFIYMVIETNQENKVNRSHQYLMYGKEEGSWIWMMATSYYPDNQVIAEL